jgi:hypothetical protein
MTKAVRHWGAHGGECACLGTPSRRWWPDGQSGDARTTNLAGHDAAGRYARLIIRELKERADYRDPELRMIVADADGTVIHIIPF